MPCKLELKAFSLKWSFPRHPPPSHLPPHEIHSCVLSPFWSAFCFKGPLQMRTHEGWEKYLPFLWDTNTQNRKKRKHRCPPAHPQHIKTWKLGTDLAILLRNLTACLEASGFSTIMDDIVLPISLFMSLSSSFFLFLWQAPWLKATYLAGGKGLFGLCFQVTVPHWRMSE